MKVVKQDDVMVAAPTVRVSSARGFKHIPALDGVRGLAILAVLVFHMNGQAQYRFQNRISEDWLTQAAVGFSNCGFVGVDLFFVLSGFLITGILIDSLHATNYFSAFFLRRSLRIFPIYYGFLLLGLVIVPAIVPVATEGYSGAVSNQWYLWTYTSNIGAALFRERFGPFAHFWSLAVEEQFYLFWPFVVRFASGRRLVYVCIACIVAAWFTRAGLLWDGRFAGAAYALMPSRLDEFGAGALLAVLIRRTDADEVIRKVARYIAVCCVGLGLTMTLAWLFGGTHSRAVLMATRCSLFAALSSSLIWYAVTSNESRLLMRALTWSPLRALGRYSYAMYLFHVPMIPILFSVQQRLYNAVHWRPGTQVGTILLFDVFAAACCYAAAWCSWHIVEKRFLNLKKGISYGSAVPLASKAGTA